MEHIADRPSTSGTNITRNITAHEEALESHPLLDGSSQDHSTCDPNRSTLRVDSKPQKRRSLSLLVHSGSIHTLKVSPKKRRVPKENIEMAALPPPVPLVSICHFVTIHLKTLSAPEFCTQLHKACIMAHWMLTLKDAPVLPIL